jgi:hypothetical protein
MKQPFLAVSVSPSLNKMMPFASWAALGLIEAEKRFRKIKGYRHLPMLIDALQKRKKALDKSAVA